MRNSLLQSSEPVHKTYRFTLNNDVEGSKALHYNPDGWEDDIEIARDQKYVGVFRKYSKSTLHFPRDGRDYIKNIRYTQGVSAVIQVQIERWENFAYKVILDGVINMISLTINEIAAVCQLEDEDKLTKLMNRAKTEIDVYRTTDLDGNETGPYPYNKNFILPEQQIQSITNFENTGQVFSDPGGGFPLTFAIPLTLLNQTFNEVQEPSPLAPLATSRGFFSNALNPYNLDIIWSIALDKHVDDEVELFLRVFDSGNIQTQSYSLTAEIFGSTELRDSGIRSIAIFGGESVTLELKWTKVGDQSFVEFVTDATTGQYTTLQVQAESPVLPIRTIHGIHLHNAFERLVLLSSGLTFSSEFYGYTDRYDEDGQQTFVTNGKNIRQLNSGIPLTLEKTFKTAHVIDNVGLGYDNGNVFVEEFEKFYKLNVVLDLTKQTTPIEYDVIPNHFNSVEVGYQKKSEEAKYGLGEYNTKAVFTTPINIDKKRPILAPYRTDTTGLVNLREKLAGSSGNEDVSGDEDNWFLDCVHSGSVWTVRQDEGFDVAPKGWFNIRFSIGRILRKHHLRPFLKFITDPFRLQQKDRLSFFSSQETGGDLIYEDNDIPVEDLPDPIFMDEKIKTKSPVSIPDIDAIDKYGLVKVDVDAYGWILKIGYSYKTQEANKIELVRADLDYVTPIEL